MTADAFATAFMVMGVEKGKDFLKNHPKIDAYFIYTDQNGKLKTFYTKGFEKRLKKD
jgi:thiamine biosynthesis lipoprotein